MALFRDMCRYSCIAHFNGKVLLFALLQLERVDRGELNGAEDALGGHKF